MSCVPVNLTSAEDSRNAAKAIVAIVLTTLPLNSRLWRKCGDHREAESMVDRGGGRTGRRVGVGIFLLYVLSVLMKPMVADLGFDRSVISFSLTCFLATTAIGTVTLGILIHRFGVRGPTFAYLAATVLCIASIPMLPPTPLAFYVLFSAMGVAGAASTALPYSVAIAGLFDRQRGLALAIAGAGGGMAGMVAPQFADFLLSHFGWRQAFAMAAAIMALPLVTLLLFVRAAPAVTAGASANAGGTDSHASLYLKNRAFWLIASAIFGIGAGTFVLAILVPLLSDRGLKPSTAAAVLSVAGLSSLASRVAIGWLLDRFWAPLVASALCLGACVGVILVAYGGASVPTALVGTTLLGVALGAEADLLTYLCSRYFSLPLFSRVVGSMWVLWAWGGGIGSTAAGLAFRATGSYQAAILFLASILVVGAVAVLFLGPYAFPPSPRVPRGNKVGSEALVAAPWER